MFIQDAESMERQEKVHLETLHTKQITIIKTELERARQENQRNLLKLQQTIRYITFRIAPVNLSDLLAPPPPSRASHVCIWVENQIYFVTIVFSNIIPKV